LNQSGGYLLDGDHDDMNYAGFSVFEIATLMERGEKIAPAVLSYLFFQIQRRLTGKPSLIVIDEAWTALKNRIFAEKIRAWLKTFRKMNCAVILATQSLADVLKSDIRDAVLESCPTKILLANPDARNSTVGELYRDFLQLNERQIALIYKMIRKREYYVISPNGRRLFSLGLGPVALAFVGSSGLEDLKRIEALKNEYGYDWPAYWLRERSGENIPLHKWADKWLALDQERAEGELENAEQLREIRRNTVDAPEDVFKGNEEVIKEAKAV
jgi:type IV secretion system protein VirB4